MQPTLVALTTRQSLVEKSKRIKRCWILKRICSTESWDATNFGIHINPTFFGQKIQNKKSTWLAIVFEFKILKQRNQMFFKNL